MDDDEQRSQFWMRVAGIGFAVWSLMLPIAALMVQSSLSDLAKSNTAMASRLENYILGMEARVTRIEERQSVVMRSIEQLQRDPRPR